MANIIENEMANTPLSEEEGRRLQDLVVDFKNRGLGLMSLNQYIGAVAALHMKAPCNMLVFGLGKDAELWLDVNKGGRTVFLEDDAEWIDTFKDQDMEIYEVKYDTKVEDHLEIGFDKEKLQMDLPEEVTNEEWDVVFVDGPLGHNPPRPYKGPGRMKSMYAAYKLLKDDGYCIVDDIGRLVEREYAYHYFGLDPYIIEGKLAIFKGKLDV